MSIASGFKKIKEYIKGSDGKYYQKSAWTSAETVEMNDGTTVQSKLTSVASDASTAKTNAASAVSTASSASSKAQQAIDGLSDKADADHTHSGYVPTSRTINGYSLTQNRTLNYNDVGAAAADHTHSGYASASHTHSNYVPTTRTINDKQLNQNISLTYSDVGAAAASHSHSEYASANHSHTGTYVPYSRKVQGTTLGSSDVTLYGTNVTMSSSDSTTLKSAIDGKANASHTHSGYASSSTTINSKSISGGSVTLYGSDIAMSSSDSTKLNTAINSAKTTANSAAQDASSALVQTSNLQAEFDAAEVSSMGKTYGHHRTNTLSLPTDTVKSVTSMTLSAGTWLIVGHIVLTNPLPTTARLQCGIHQNQNASGLQTRAAGADKISVSDIITFTTSTTIYLLAHQDSGSTVTVAGDSTIDNSTRLVATKIGKGYSSIDWS